MSKYPVIKSERGKFTEWQTPISKGYKMACCDCGLVHDMNFRVRNGVIQFQVRRNNRATGAIRRHTKHKN